MTGLMWKDFFVMRKALKTYLLITLVYIGLAFLELFDFSFVVTLVVVILMVVPLSAFAYDEQTKWDRYAVSLPVKRSQVVGARYLCVFILALFSMALGLVGTAVVTLLHKAEPMEMLLTLMVSTFIGLMVPSIMLPLCYKLGSERARPYIYAIIFLPTLAILTLVKFDILDLSGLNRLDSLPPALLAVGFILLPLSALAVLAVSWLISCRIMMGKEF